jgi:hypothetical protein
MGAVIVSWCGRRAGLGRVAHVKRGSVWSIVGQAEMGGEVVVMTMMMEVKVVEVKVVK